MGSGRHIPEAVCWRRRQIPGAFLTSASVEGRDLTYGGDIRLGDLNGDGQAELLVYRCEAASGLKPCFLGAFTLDGEVLWQVGEGGVQPERPGPVAIHDIDGDGCAEVICFFHRPAVDAARESMADVLVQVRDGRTGELKCEAAPPALQACSGWGANWVHQRLLMADLRGAGRAGDFVVKLGDTVVAFDDKLQVLWTYRIAWNEYGSCSAYIPAVGDIDGDGCDEVLGGYFLLTADGEPRWEKQLAPHMDSVAITVWDDGNMRAVCSGGGHVLDADGNVVLALGEDLVPHGQEVRLGHFLADEPGPQMVIRYLGHRPDVMVVTTDGRVVRRFQLNPSPNETGMERVQWCGADRPDLLYNGGMLFDGDGRQAATLPGLPAPVGPTTAGWHHCIPADLCGDAREEMLLYNPWGDAIFVYTPAPLDHDAYAAYRPGPRQYNARLMD